MILSYRQCCYLIHLNLQPCQSQPLAHSQHCSRGRQAHQHITCCHVLPHTRITGTIKVSLCLSQGMLVAPILALCHKFKLAIKMNGWTYQEAANHLACSLTREAQNCLNKVSCADDLDDYEHPDASFGRLVLF